jgi:hypothetical protein
MGKDVVITGSMFPPPVVRTGKAYPRRCTAEEGAAMGYHSWGNLSAEFTVPWREKLDAVSALAVEDACRVVN